MARAAMARRLRHLAVLAAGASLVRGMKLRQHVWLRHATVKLMESQRGAGCMQRQLRLAVVVVAVVAAGVLHNRQVAAPQPA